MPPKTNAKSSHRPFRQPLAVALVCVVLISLLLVMGNMNIRALTRTLNGYMEKSCMMVVETVQKGTEEMLQQLRTIEPRIFDPMTGTFSDENIRSMEEDLINGLIDVAREADMAVTDGDLDREGMASFLSGEGITQICFLDEKGHFVCQNGPVPEKIRKASHPVIRGEQIFATNIFSRNTAAGALRYLTVCRGSAKGSIILLLDEAGFQYRCLRVCLAAVLTETARLPDKSYTYLVVHDQSDRLLEKIGTPVNKQAHKVSHDPLFESNQLHTLKVETPERIIIEVSAPFTIFGETVGAITLGLKADDLIKNISENKRNIMLSVGFIVMITVLAMWLLYKNQVRYLADKEEMQRQIHRAERLSALGRLAAGVAHEVRNPLNAISMAVQRLHKERPHRLNQVIRNEIHRLNRIIEDFIVIAKSRRLEFTPCPIKRLLEQIVLLVREEAASKDISVQTQWPEKELIISVDRDKIKQALLNVIKNAMESISDQGRVWISLQERGKERVCIKIADTGTGLTREQVRQIFDLDYTTKEKGLGLGLPLSHEIVKGHGGEMRVTSTPGQGTVFEILLPLHDGSK